MNKYISSGFRPVMAESMKQAAEIFANRQARRDYGKTAYARTLNCEAHAQDNRMAEFNAFIGVTTGRHETSGHNFRFSVRLA